ncbi:acyltransferase [Cytobacillus oceanisediminis]|uniref:acyltransferase family protein n=1 Tax=Cytobacillus oceanisediminis TaxID=665099 RepID=UPI001CCD80AC|nr:acyltransferase [Cytobacillus oceanisediminis]MBZ9536851.1 acyltransferase [Cytobacillus oceanisediminis]
MDLLVIILLVILLSNIKISTKGQFADYLDPKVTNQLKGIFTLVVIFHHLSQRTGEGILFNLFSYVGYLAVSVFFFISGYGLMIQYQRKREKYLESFVKLRIPSILLPYILTTIIYFFSFKLLGENVSLKTTFLSLINGNPLVSFSWYIIAILFFYCLFYIAGKISKRIYYKFIIVIFLGIFLYISLCKIAGYDSWWYNSCFSFFIGIIWANYNDLISIYFKKIYVLKIVFISFIFLLLFMIPLLLPKYELNQTILKNIIIFSQFLSSSLFSILVMLICKKIRLNNYILLFLGGISLEIYLFQGLLIKVLRNNLWEIENDIIFSLLVIILTILVAFFSNYIFRILIMTFQRVVSVK